VGAQQVVIKKEVPVGEKDKPVDEIKKPVPVPTNEGFAYGEWKFLRGINNYLPGYSGNIKAKVVESKVWILKDGEKFNPDSSADSVKYFDTKGNRIKDISYTHDVSGNIYEYDLNNRLVSITPIIADEVKKNKKIVFKYFKKMDGSILRKSYVNSGLVLEEIETKIDNGWQYISKKEGYGDFFYKVQITEKNGHIYRFIDFSDVVGNTHNLFEYDRNILKKVKTITEGEKIPFRMYEYFYGEDGLLNEVHLFDPRKNEETLIRQSTFSDYDENGNWQKNIVTFATGGKETVIRRFTYSVE